MEVCSRRGISYFFCVLVESPGSLWGSEIYPVLWDKLHVREGHWKREVEVYFLSVPFGG